MANNKLRNYAKGNNVFLWEIAMKMNVSEMSLIRKLRTELSEEQTSKIMYYIDEIAREKGGGEKAIRTDDVYEEMRYLYNLTKSAYEFNARNTDYTDYSKGYDKGYLKGMEAMLEHMKGILYGNKNE